MTSVLLSKSTQGQMYTTKCYPDRNAHLASLVCLRYRLPQLWPAPPVECQEILHEITITVMACYFKPAGPQIQHMSIVSHVQPNPDREHLSHLACQDADTSEISYMKRT